MREAPTTRAEVSEIYAAAATRSAPASTAPAGTSSRRRRRCSSGRRSPSAYRARGLPRVRLRARPRGRRRGEPGHRLRQARRGLRPLRARRERTAHRASGARTSAASSTRLAHGGSRPRDRSFRRGADERGVLRERAVGVTRRRRSPLEQPPVELVVRRARRSARARLDVDRRRCRRRASAAIGPPRNASGETWPTIRPCVAPEKRPSVISAIVVAEALADERGGDVQHLAHPRPAGRASRSG